MDVMTYRRNDDKIYKKILNEKNEICKKILLCLYNHNNPNNNPLGLTITDIARKIDSSPRTVKKHVNEHLREAELVDVYLEKMGNRTYYRVKLTEKGRKFIEEYLK
jgi:DNA-binding transcriptional ArsR family regulator